MAWIDLALDYRKVAGSCVYSIESSGYIKYGNTCVWTGGGCGGSNNNSH